MVPLEIPNQIIEANLYGQRQRRAVHHGLALADKPYKVFNKLGNRGIDGSVPDQPLDDIRGNRDRLDPMTNNFFHIALNSCPASDSRSL